jgi:hypothetical protein
MRHTLTDKPKTNRTFPGLYRYTGSETLILLVSAETKDFLTGTVLVSDHKDWAVGRHFVHFNKDLFVPLKQDLTLSND